MEPPPPGGPGAWSSQPSPFPWGPKCLDSWEGSKGMWADGPEAGRSPQPQLPADRAPLWGLNTVSNLPRPPTHCVPLRRGARAALGWRRPGRPHGSQLGPCHPAPSPGIDTGSYPLSTVPQSCSCSQAAGLAVPLPRGAFVRLPSPARGGSPCPRPHPQGPTRGLPAGWQNPACCGEKRVPALCHCPPCRPPVPTRGSGLECPGLS